MKQFIRSVVAHIPLAKPLYHVWQKKRKLSTEKKKLRYKGNFTNRSRNCERLCIVLAGYKPFLYSAVLGRLNAFQMPDMDVCVVSSGLFSQELSDICKQNNWSYLAIKRNNVCLALNVAIHLHPASHYIFKVDEDIFVTKNCFEKMISAYEHAQSSEYHPGVIAPLISVNAYSYVTILEKYGLIDEYTKRFEKPQRVSGCSIWNNPAAARFMWGGKDTFCPLLMK